MAEAAGLYYETHGPEDAPVVLLSPGLGGSATYWAANIAALAATRRVIAYDHRGTGRSDRGMPPVESVARMAADVVALLDALDIAHVDLVGHAAGALIGLQLALDAPARLGRLVAVNGWARRDPHFARCFAARRALLRDSGVEAFLRAQPIFLFPAPWISRHDAVLEAELAQQIAHFPGVATIEARIAALAAFDVADRLTDIPHPVLALASRDDMLVPWPCSQTLATGLPRGRFEAIAWGGHAVNVTDPAGFGAVVLNFLSEP